MKITDINIKKLTNEDSNSKLKGIASIVIDDCFVIHGIKILEGIHGYFIAMPSKKSDDGKYIDIVHPVNSLTYNLITDSIIQEFNKINKEENNG